MMPCECTSGRSCLSSFVCLQEQFSERSHGPGKRTTYGDDLAGERRPGRSCQLDVEILAEHGGVARNQDRSEVARSRLQKIAAAARFLLDEHLVSPAQLCEVRGARHRSHGRDEGCETLAR